MIECISKIHLKVYLESFLNHFIPGKTRFWWLKFPRLRNGSDMLSIFPCFSMEKNRRNIFLFLVLQHASLQRHPVHQNWEQSWCHGTGYHCSFLLDCSSSCSCCVRRETEEADTLREKYQVQLCMEHRFLCNGHWTIQMDLSHSFGYIKEKESNNYGSFPCLKNFMGHFGGPKRVQ